MHAVVVGNAYAWQLMDTCGGQHAWQLTSIVGDEQGGWASSDDSNAGHVVIVQW